MAGTYLKVSNIRPGITISEDVFVNTKFPIIKKSTLVTTEHIEVLHAFGVNQVKVEEHVVIKKGISEENLEPSEFENTMLISEIEIGDIRDQYSSAVTNYKKEFNGWRAGTRPDIAKVRALIIPLLEAFTAQSSMLTLLSDLSDPKEYLYHHSIAVGILASSISREMGHTVGQTLQIGLAGVLADCGMAKIDPSITEKAAFLSKAEFNEVKKHTVYSYQMLQETPLLLQEMKLAIFQHHERLDGSGYPRGNKLEEISLASQILAVADVFHAMTSERVYRAKESPFKVIEMITEEEFGKFDINVVLALHKLVGDLSIGTKVQLTNGEEGKVIFVHRDARLRPTIKMDKDSSILNLTTNRHLAVERVLL